AKPKPDKRVIEQVEAFVAQARQSPSGEVRKRGEFIAAQIQPYKLGLLPAADLLGAQKKKAATPPTRQGDRTPDLHETEFVLEVLKLAAKVAPLLLLLMKQPKGTNLREAKTGQTVCAHGDPSPLTCPLCKLLQSMSDKADKCRFRRLIFLSARGIAD